MTDEPDHPQPKTGDRIAKVLARAGVASRRAVEAMIAEGRVKIDGAVVDTPATLVEGTRGITVDGKPVGNIAPTGLWKFHKPSGLVTTNKDPEGRPTVFSALPQRMPRVIAVGRLDINTEGLLLLTNDGEFARWLELPASGLVRRYRVRAWGAVDDAALKALADGVTVDGVGYGPIDAAVERRQGDNVWLTMALREGKNREVKRVLEHLGLRVNRLIRAAYGPVALGMLARGGVEAVSDEILSPLLRAFHGKTVSEPHTITGAEPPARKRAKGWARAKPKPNARPQSKPRARSKSGFGNKPGPKAKGPTSGS